MKKRGKLVLSVFVCAILALFLISFASAEITFSNLTKNIYNYGDNFTTSVEITRNQDSNGFFSAKMACGSNELELIKSPYTLSSGIPQTIPLSIKLDKVIIGSFLGECVIKAEYLTDIARSETFQITSDLDISSSSINESYNPGSEITISGKVTKKDSSLLNGFVELSIPSLNVLDTKQTSNGEFSASLILPNNARSGNYIISINAYEKDSYNETTNHGTSGLPFKVNQVLTSLEIASNSQQVKPGTEITYSLLLKDQSGEEITDTDVSVSIKNSKGESVSAKSLKSSQSESFKTESNSPPGIWSISAKVGDLNAERLFGVEELESVSFSLVNDTLIIKNTGNVPYKKDVSILIGANRTFNKSLSLEIGASSQFKLNAPKGEYDIKVNDGANTQALGKAYLTGNAISAQSLKQLAGSKFSWIFWALVIIVLGYFIYRYYDKIKIRPFKSGVPAAISTPIKVNSKEATGIASSIAGEKQDCTVIALKIKNLDALKSSDSNALESINLALTKARGAKASVFEQNEYRMMVIPKAVARNTELALIAAQISKEVNSVLVEHNKKYNQKIEYGIGANLGELIVENIGGKFKFGSIGNTIQLSKKIAEVAQNEVLISEKVRNRAMKDLKVERKGDYWAITNIKDHSAHNEFIARFMSNSHIFN